MLKTGKITEKYEITRHTLNNWKTTKPNLIKGDRLDFLQINLLPMNSRGQVNVIKSPKIIHTS